MSLRPFSVRVLLTEECPDSLDEIIHGDGSSLGPTFDKIQQIAVRYNGCFEDWEPLCCDYSFPTKEDAKKFIKSIRLKFKEQVTLEHVIKNKKDDSSTRNFKKLPDKTLDRIAALTPKVIFSSFNINISLLDNDDCFAEDKNGEIFTHIGIKCKVTGKIRSRVCFFKSATEAIKPFTKESTSEINKAIEAGWTMNDISYDAFINGVLCGQLDSIYKDNDIYHEVFLACNTIQVIVYDYLGKQLIGWVFYNENLDEILSYTNYNV